jgi:hypothetical protein
MGCKAALISLGRQPAWRIIIFGMVLAFSLVPTMAEPIFPTLSGRIVDEANVLIAALCFPHRRARTFGLWCSDVVSKQIPGVAM